MIVGIYMFDQVEVLDFAGPYEVFGTADRVARRAGRDWRFSPCTISHDGGPVTARAGLKVSADHAFTNHPPLDLLLVPGGVVDDELKRPALRHWLKQQRLAVDTLASVCTGAFLLAEAGLLDGLAATTHWEDADQLRRRYPQLQVHPGSRWVDQGHVITSAGIAAGIDMCLHLVARLAEPELARLTARQMDYPWNPSGEDQRRYHVL